jgi:hypothetical protein
MSRHGDRVELNSFRPKRANKYQKDPKGSKVIRGNVGLTAV